MCTKTVIVPDEHLEQMLAQWKSEQGGNPQFREPKCWSCGKKMRGKMWHVFFRTGLREAHLCKACGKPYEVTHVATYAMGELLWHDRPTPKLRKKLRDLMVRLGL